MAKSAIVEARDVVASRIRGRLAQRRSLSPSSRVQQLEQDLNSDQLVKQDEESVRTVGFAHRLWPPVWTTVSQTGA
jgi:hypothetical protein